MDAFLKDPCHQLGGVEFNPSWAGGGASTNFLAMQPYVCASYVLILMFHFSFHLISAVGHSIFTIYRRTFQADTIQVSIQ